MTRPTMRFVPIKGIDQQAILVVHRARQGFVKARTAQANQIRGLLAEFGIVIRQGLSHIPKRLPEILEESENGLPGRPSSSSENDRTGRRSGLTTC